MDHATPIPAVPSTRTTPPRTYTLLEIVFAWLCLLEGYLFCRVFPVLSSPFGGFLLILLLYLGTTMVFVIKKIKLRPLPTAAAALALVLSLSLVLCANGLIAWLAYVFALITYGYYIYAALGNTVTPHFSGLILADYWNALCVYPFHSLTSMGQALFSGRTAKKSGKFLLKILLGVLIAVIPTAVVCSLLSYDRTFTALLNDILDLDFSDIFSHLFSLLVGIVIGMYIFGLYVSAADQRAEGALTPTALSNTAKGLRSVSAVTVLVASLPLLFLYVVFFISQWQYYISGFTGKLPAELSYAQYAREGFFQLCWVAVINLALLLGISLFFKRKSETPPLLLKILSLIYALFTLVLISTAISKMALYIKTYGLTQKRVYASCIMLLLAVIFLTVIVKQFAPKTPVVAISLLAALGMLVSLSYGNLDTQIARYNIDRYLDGTLDDVDLFAMQELGEAAIPELCRMAQILDARQGSDICHDPDAESKLSEIYYDYDANCTTTYYRLRYTLATAAAESTERAAEDDRSVIEKIFAFHLPTYRAERSLQEIGLIE